MADYYTNVLKISGMGIERVLAAVKADAPHVDEDGQTHEVYFDPQRISGSHSEVGAPHIFPDDQKIWDEDGSPVIRFDTAAYPAFYPTLWLSGVFPTPTLQLKSRLQSEGSDPSIVLFRGGEASHVYRIPNHSGNTGKTATLFEIFCSHINRFSNEQLDDCIESALEVVQRVKAERLAGAEKTKETGDHAEDSGESEIVYNFALDKEVEAIIRPFLYTCDMISGDEQRIARLVADLRSIETPAKRIEFLKTKTRLDLNFIVPEPGRPARFAILPCDLFEEPNPGRDISVAVPVIHYANADPTTGKYTKTSDGTFPDIEWEIRYLYATRDDLREIKKLPDDKHAPCDIDIVITWSPRSITMKHGGPSGPIYGIERVSNHARWKKDPGVVAEVEAAIHRDRAEAKMITIVVGQDLLTNKDPRTAR